MIRPPLHLVACVAGKADTAQPAADLYRSDWFNKARAYVEAIGAPWLILSAKHGLLDPARIIEPYDETLIGKPRADRLAWGEPIAAALSCIAVPVVFLAGEQYRDAITGAPWGETITFSAPLAGMGIGQQKAWLARQVREIQARA